MNKLYAAVAAILFAGGTAGGFATGTLMASDSAEEEQRAVAELDALKEEQRTISNSISERERALEVDLANLLSDQEKISAQLEELSNRQDQAAQREAELEAQSAELEEKLASADKLEEDLTRKYENLDVVNKALEEQKTELARQKEMIAARLESASERETELDALAEKLAAQELAAQELAAQELAAQEIAAKELAAQELTAQKPDTQIAAGPAQDLVDDVVSELDFGDAQLVPKAAPNPALPDAELSAVALQEPATADKKIGEGIQAETVSEAVATQSEPVTPSNAPITEVHFELNSASLTPGALQRAHEAAARLQNMKFSKVRIAGHTDTTGPASRNQALSNERAEAVAQIFVQAGLPRQMIEIVGFGETQDMLPISTADGISEPLNRCVGIYVEEVAQTSIQ